MNESSKSKLPQSLPPELAQAAERLAKNNDLKIVLTALIEDYTLQWANTSPEEKELREECYIKQATLTDFQGWVKYNGTGS